MPEIKLENIFCDFCGSKESFIVLKNVVDNDLGKPGKFNVVQCRSCALTYLNPRPAKEEIQNYYPSQYSAYQKESWFFIRLRELIWQSDKNLTRKLISKNSFILEIGSARGEFLRFLDDKKYAYNLYGLEMDKQSADFSRERHKYGIWQGEFENFNFRADLKFNFIIMHYVLEHLFSPKKAFTKLKSLMDAGGYALITIPNFDSLERRIFGRYWQGLETPRHLYFFTEKAIRGYAEEAGLEVIRVRYSFVPNDWIWGINRFLKENGLASIAFIFQPKNIILLAIFLPFSLFSFLIKKSSRFSLVLKNK